MKKIAAFVLLFTVTGFSGSMVFGQINVLNRVKRVVNERIDREIDKAVNKQLDTLEKKVTEKKVEKIEKSVEKKIQETMSEEPQVNVKITEASGKALPVSNPKGKGKYAIKSAVIDYKTTAMGFDTQQTLYFYNYGEKEANETLMKVMGFKSNMITIFGDNCMYTVDLVKRTAVKSTMDDNPAGLDFERLSEEMQREWKIKKESNEDILGRNCIKYSMTNEKNGISGFVWIWKGISLKTELKFKGITTKMEATEIKESVPVPAEKFEIPGDVTIEEYVAED